MQQRIGVRGRRGMFLFVALGVALLVLLMMVNVSTFTLGEARLGATQVLDAEQLYVAEALVAQEANRLKKRPWAVRYFSRGGYGTGPHLEERGGAYHGARFRTWTQDVPMGQLGAVPGLVDVFVRVTAEDLTRQFHYRLSLLPPSLRRSQGVETQYFARTAADLTSEQGRAAAAAVASRVLMETELNRARTESALDLLPAALRQGYQGGFGSEDFLFDSTQLVDSLLGANLGPLAAAQEEARTSFQIGIHLMAEDGQGFQSLLPAVQRRRFIFREADHDAAREQLGEAVASAGNSVVLRSLATLAIGRSFLVDAWRLGPRSENAQEFLQEGWTTLVNLINWMDSLPAAYQKQIDPTLRTSAFIDMARMAAIAMFSDDREMAIERAVQAAQGARIYGGSQDVELAVARAMEPFRTVEARIRMISDEALPESGFKPIKLAEVRAFVADPENGWGRFPEDSGKNAQFWQDRWEEQMARQGEGASEDQPPWVDLNADGLVDQLTVEKTFDKDGDGLSDDHLFDGAIRECVSAVSCVGPDGELDENCLLDCAQTAIVARYSGVLQMIGGKENKGNGKRKKVRSEENPVLKELLKKLDEVNRSMTPPAGATATELATAEELKEAKRQCVVGCLQETTVGLFDLSRFETCSAQCLDVVELIEPSTTGYLDGVPTQFTGPELGTTTPVADPTDPTGTILLPTAPLPPGP